MPNKIKTNMRWALKDILRIHNQVREHYRLLVANICSNDKVKKLLDIIQTESESHDTQSLSLMDISQLIVPAFLSKNRFSKRSRKKKNFSSPEIAAFELSPFNSLKYKNGKMDECDRAIVRGLYFLEILAYIKEKDYEENYANKISECANGFINSINAALSSRNREITSEDLQDIAITDKSTSGKYPFPYLFTGVGVFGIVLSVSSMIIMGVLSGALIALFMLLPLVGCGIILGIGIIPYVKAKLNVTRIEHSSVPAVKRVEILSNELITKIDVAEQGQIERIERNSDEIKKYIQGNYDQFFAYRAARRRASGKMEDNSETDVLNLIAISPSEPLALR